MSNSEEWEFFKRIEKLEKIAKGLKATEATAEDNRTILLVLFWLAFSAKFALTPQIARAGKDQIMRTLKALGLSQQMLDALEEIMLKTCDAFERKR